MKAAVFAGAGRVEIKDEAPPALSSSRDVIVRVEVCGICRSEISALGAQTQVDVKPGVILGHEFVGEVVDAGPESQQLLGERVVADPNIHCGRCHYCRSGEPQHCDNCEHLGATLNGAFADLCVLPGDAVHLVPRGLDGDLAALAEPLACVLNATTRAGWAPGSPVVIQGAGRTGLLFCMLAKLAGATPLIVSEPSATRRQEALRAGADIVLDPTCEDLVEMVHSVTDGRGAHVVVDAVGTLLDQALGCLRKGGKALISGVDETARATITPSLIANRGLSVEGAYSARASFPLALTLLSAYPDRFGALATGRFGLAEFDDGVAAVRAGRRVSVLVYPGGLPPWHAKTGADDEEGRSS